MAASFRTSSANWERPIGPYEMNRRGILAAGAAWAAARVVPVRAQTPAYPTRPVRLVVGYAAGGSTDIVGRIIGQWLSERLGQSFVIENRPGAGTNIATE